MKEKIKIKRQYSQRIPESWPEYGRCRSPHQSDGPAQLTYLFLEIIQKDFDYLNKIIIILKRKIRGN